jgi:asparagine synthetase B (glutamine-hydrolysing)
MLSAGTTRDLVSEYRRWFDEPFGDVSAFPTNWLARFARERGAIVVLTGDGGDELFGGYRRYSRFARYSRWPAVGPRGGALLTRARELAAGHASVRRTLTSSTRAQAIWSSMRLLGSPSLQARLVPPACRSRRTTTTSWYYRRYWRCDLPADAAAYLDFHTFLPDLVLTKVDRTTMAESLEARVPLLARRVVELGSASGSDVTTEVGRGYSSTHFATTRLPRSCRGGSSASTRRALHRRTTGAETRQEFSCGCSSGGSDSELPAAFRTCRPLCPWEMKDAGRTLLTSGR